MIVSLQLQPYFKSRDWDGLTTHLARLGKTAFIRAEHSLRCEILPDLPLPVFWTVLTRLVLFRKSAFITSLTALGNHAADDGFTLLSDESREFASALFQSFPDFVPKAVSIALPYLVSERQIEELFELFAIDDMHQRTACLIRIESPLACFVLFKTLKMISDDAAFVRKCCLYYVRRGNDQSANMAAILRAYFDIPDVPNLRSILISTYELSYLDRNYKTFLNILNGRRPKM